MHSRMLVCTLALLIGLLARPALADEITIELVRLGTYASGIFDPDDPAAEIVVHDPQKQRLFVVNGHDRAIDVLNIKNPANPSLLFSIDVPLYGSSPTSVDVDRRVGKIFGRTFAFNRDFTGDPEAGTAGDLGPEGLIFIPAGQSPNNKHLLVVANEVSGTTTIFQINRRRLP